MSSVERPDGVELHWEAQGEGPLVVLVLHLWSYPEIYGDLVSDLRRDHRVVVFHPRGYGQSTRRGPYDLDTDTEDLLAVVESTGGRAIALAIGSGFNSAGRASVARPDVVTQVVAISPATAAFLPPGELRDSGVMAASESVTEMMMQMLSTDPRTGLRTLIAASNQNLDEQELRNRVERSAAYITLDAGLARARAWLDADMNELASALGDRLWILYSESDPLFEGAPASRVPELLENAHFENVGDGPVSNPELTAATVRRVTGRGKPPC